MWICLATILGVWGDVFWFAVMVCAVMDVCEARCVANGGKGDEVERCGRVPVRWVLGAG